MCSLQLSVYGAPAVLPSLPVGDEEKKRKSPSAHPSPSVGWPPLFLAPFHRHHRAQAGSWQLVDALRAACSASSKRGKDKKQEHV